MRYPNEVEAKAVATPNHAALQHAGLALILVLVIFFSLIEMARVALSRPAALPDIVSVD